tara:strand:+ start:905 stop:1078 length:174 start_codon:yes stop_codon:yes gene_type:complete
MVFLNLTTHKIKKIMLFHIDKNLAKFENKIINKIRIIQNNELNYNLILSEIIYLSIL